MVIVEYYGAIGLEIFCLWHILEPISEHYGKGFWGEHIF